MPGRALDMSDGWETKRRRGPGHDWTIIRLGKRGRIRRLEVDTAHFKGNFPESCSLEGTDAARDELDDMTVTDSFSWTELLPRTRLQAHTRHFFDEEIKDVSPLTHLRFNIYPDGGVSRLRAMGIVEEREG
jgi:allantoicase